MVRRRRFRFRRWHVLSVPIALVSFAVAAAAGLLMLISSATEIVTNRAFQIKLGLIADGRRQRLVVSSTRQPCCCMIGVAKAQSLLSIVLWIGVIACGRLIAYV